MTHNDALTIIGLGLSLFLGSLRMNASNRFIPLLMRFGWILITGGVAYLIYDSPILVKTVCAAAVFVLTLMTYTLSQEAHRSANLENHIYLYERNGENWDNGRPNESTCLTSGDENEPIVLRRAYQETPARFTPVVNSLYDSLTEKTRIWITIHGTQLKFDDEKKQLIDWRPVLNDPTKKLQFVGEVDAPIHHGKTKTGPDGIIKVHFVPGEYRVDYFIEGESRKGCPFQKSGHFIVQIYEALVDAPIPII